MDKAGATRVDLSREDFEALAASVEAVGTADFAARICRFCLAVSGGESVFLSAFFDQAGPLPLYTSHSGAQTVAALATYVQAAYLLDPFYQRFRDRRGDEVMRLCDIAPDQFRQSEYYLRFYQAMALRDECGLMVRIDPSSALFFSFGLHRAGRSIDPARLDAVLPLIKCLVVRHSALQSGAEARPGGVPGLQLESALDSFGSPALSPREQQIARLVLKGHSSKAIARLLANSPETIKVHRRRIYAKLGVSSQGELLSLFLASITPAASGG